MAAVGVGRRAASNAAAESFRAPDGGARRRKPPRPNPPRATPKCLGMCKGVRRGSAQAEDSSGEPRCLRMRLLLQSYDSGYVLRQPGLC
eukprot:365974-Chlamydomonas_euryale.AAC.13